MTASQSEVARLIEQIDTEYAAARLGLTGMSEGSARHAFIATHMERAQQASEALIETVGTEQALPLIVEAMERGAS